MSKIKNKLIKSTNSVMSWIFGNKPDEQYDYENAVYRIQMNEAHAEDLELKEKFEKDHPVDAVESLETVNKFIAKKKGKHHPGTIIKNGNIGQG